MAKRKKKTAAKKTSRKARKVTPKLHKILIIDSLIKMQDVSDITAKLLTDIKVDQAFNQSTRLCQVDNEDAEMLKDRFNYSANKVPVVVIVTDKTTSFDSLFPLSRNGEYDSHFLKFIREIQKDYPVNVVSVSSDAIPDEAVRNMKRLGIPLVQVEPNYKAVASTVKKTFKR